MPIICWALILLAGVWVVFIALPAVIAFVAVFTPKREKTLDSMDLSKTYYAPYAEELLTAKAALEALSWRRVTIHAADGVLLAGEYLDGDFPRTVLFVHGYHTSPMANFALQARDLRTRGWNVFFLHQRGHAPSGGGHIALGIREQDDLLRWIDYLREIGAGDIALYGISMGCATVAYAADRLAGTPVRAMVLDCGFTSPYEQLLWDCRIRHLPGHLLVPVICACGRLFLHIDIRRKVAPALAKTDVPALFLHGEADRTVPVEQGRENYAACASRKDCLFVPGAAHTMSYAAAGESAREKLETFLDTYVCVS